MKIFRYIVISLGIVLCFSATKAAEKQTVKTLDIAELVLNKGFNHVDFGLYPGTLLLEGMSELALIHPTKKEELMAKTIALFQKYPTKEINGRGSFICYETGGNGAAYLYFLGKADVLRDQVLDGAKRMMEKQQRSPEGILIPHWAKKEQVFIDIAFPVTPYLLYAGLAFDKPEYVDMAVFETTELYKILRDQKTGLVHQGRDFNGKGVISEDNWSEGSGWGALALAKLIRDLPANHPKRKEVEQLAVSFFKAVLKYQDKDGMWHQEMTDKTSFVETSGTGLLLYALGVMVEKELLGKECKKNIERGLRGYLAYIDCDGSVSHTCKGCLCPGNGKKEDYINYEWVLNDPHAFGPTVLAFTQAYKIGISEI